MAQNESQIQNLSQIYFPKIVCKSKITFKVKILQVEPRHQNYEFTGQSGFSIFYALTEYFTHSRFGAAPNFSKSLDLGTLSFDFQNLQLIVGICFSQNRFSR